jgi:hypothetical protein
MPELGGSLTIFIGFSLSLLALAWLGNQVSLHIQIPVYLLTRSPGLAMVVLFLVFWPGVMLHEGAHWLMAQLLGLKTGKFRVWPEMRKDSLRLGSVTVHSGGPVAISLVGMAPLVVGVPIIALIGHRIFGAHAVIDAFAQGRWLDGIEVFWLALRSTDGLVWAFFLFAIANAMMPSESDRAAAMPVLQYAAVVAVFYFLLGLPLAPLDAALAWLAPVLQDLSSALIFTILLDLVVLAVLVPIRLLLGGL